MSRELKCRLWGYSCTLWFSMQNWSFCNTDCELSVKLSWNQGWQKISVILEAISTFLHCYFVSARAGQNVEIIIYYGKWVLKAHDGISSGLYRALQQDQTFSFNLSCLLSRSKHDQQFRLPVVIRSCGPLSVSPCRASPPSRWRWWSRAPSWLRSGRRRSAPSCSPSLRSMRCTGTLQPWLWIRWGRAQGKLWWDARAGAGTKYFPIRN